MRPALYALALAALLVGAFIAGRMEVLDCADRIHYADPRGVREICGSVWEIYR